MATAYKMPSHDPEPAQKPLRIAPTPLRIALFSGNYNYVRDGANQALRALEALRTLRLLHYSGWIARRWHDPAFPAAFPWFNTQRYWQDRVLELREQISAMQEPALSLAG